MSTGPKGAPIDDDAFVGFLRKFGVIAANPDKVAQVQAKPTMLGWFVGQVMKATGGKANPQSVNALLKDKLGI